MNVKKNIIRFWVIFLVVLSTALGAITVAHRWHRIFPSDEVSEYYARYAGCEGMDVSYVKDYRINDTLLLDVTVLEVTDSAVWEQVCKELHLLTTAQIPKEFFHLYFTPNNFESRIEQDTVLVDNTPQSRKTLFIYSRYNKTICIFHHVTDEEYDAIMEKNIDEI